jgi:hypothetical protein
VNNNVYFSIGDAVAGLGIFLLIPQFLKPVYIFRLRVLGMGLRTLYAMSGVGFLCAIIAALSQYFPDTVPQPFRASLFWEIIGGFLFATSYGTLGVVYIFPARAGLESITKYVRAGAHLLASGSEEDRVEFAADILANINKLIRIADLTEKKMPAITKLKLSFYRKSAAEVAASAESFLRLLADPGFCRTLVTRLPWDAARILNAFSTERPEAPVGRAFVHQIIRQALIAGETLGTKEDDWRGFSDAPALSQAAFADAFLNHHYLPWEGMTASDMNVIDQGLMERIERAARLTIDQYVADRFSYQSYNIAHLQETFEALSRRITLLKKADTDASLYANALGRSVKYIVEVTRRYARALEPEERRALYADAEGARGFSVFDALAEMVITVLENTAYDFAGFDDQFWTMAREIWDAMLPRFASEGAGMDPLQQRFAMKLIEKTKENLEGYYSPLPRQALAIIGPYAAKGETGERSSFKICRDLFYREFEAFPAFYDKDPERAKTFLPNNVRYESETKELIHRYSFGGEDRTDLSALDIPDIALDGEIIEIAAPSGAKPAVVV